MIENQKVIKVTYDLFVPGEEGTEEELMERATERHPLTYCHGENMMLPKFEENLAGLEVGDSFDFRIPCQDAYGEYDEAGLQRLPRSMFEIDGELDLEHVFVGNIVPMNTADGQVVNAQIVEVGKQHVTIDLNHPLAGEDLHFVGKVIAIRDASENELKAIRGEGGCGGHCGGQCGGCDKGDGSKHECGNCHSSCSEQE